MMGATKTNRREAPETEAAVKTETPETNAPETNAPANPAPAAFGGYEGLPVQVSSLRGLNLRQGPARAYEVLEVLPDGGAVTLLPLPYGAEVPGWGLAVSESGTLGWVMTAFLAGPPKET